MKRDLERDFFGIRLMKRKLINLLDKISLFSIGAMVFLVPFSAHFLKRFFFLGVGCLIIRKILEWKWPFRKNYLNVPVLIFVLTMLFITLVSTNIYESQKVFIGRILFY
ncbi:MAG: hypothetical protein KKF54_05700, partial [Candidatus Omnitrophica bacterium]|nr:hypothetical protein [Candidatus Omnitrophota bacterium]